MLQISAEESFHNPQEALLPIPQWLLVCCFEIVFLSRSYSLITWFNIPAKSDGAVGILIAGA